MRWLLILALFISAESFGQCKTFTIGRKGDTLNCTDVKGNRQGRWMVRVEQVRLQPGYEEEGFYVDGRKEGTWRQFTLMGDLKAVENYRFGLKDGICQYYNVQAGLIREESWKAIDPQNPYDTIDVQDVHEPTKFTKVRIKLEGTTLRHGTWKYYDEYTGALVKTEKWNLNKLEDPNAKKTAIASVGDNDKVTSDSAKPAPKVKPKEVMDFEKKNAGKKKVKVRDGKTGG
jgi:hypothetical protein